jgi:hypothetical protein
MPTKKRRIIKTVAITLGVLIVTAVAYAAGSKKPNEECKVDDECRKGHCYTKKSDGKQVCVDCSSSTISGYRNLVQEWCKEKKRACKGSSELEVAESYYTTRIEANEKCIRAKDENKDCWDEGDDGHKRAVIEAETALNTCNSDFSTRKSDGTIYKCSDSTYSSKAADATSYCNAYGNACDSMSRDSTPVDCGEIEKSMKKTDMCVVAIERLDSDCLPRLSRKRENQFGKAKTAYDKCKEILAYKKDNKLCK